MRGGQVISGLRYVPSIKLSVLRKVFSLMGRREKMVLAMLLVLGVSSLLYTVSQAYARVTMPVPTTGGTYREGIIGQPRFINPLLATSDTDDSIVKLVFAGLYKYDGYGQIEPDLAEDMPAISPDGKEYTVKIRGNAKWHNGLPVNADDVIFTIKTLQDQAYNSPRRAGWQSTTAEKIDNNTVVFKIKGASGPFIHNLTLPIISKNVWEKVSPQDFVLSQSNIEAIGSGPYVIKEVRKTPEGSVQSMTLQSFATYHHGQAFIDTIKLNFYENVEGVLNAIHGKQIDGFGFSPFEQNVRLNEANNEFAITQVPLPQYQAVFFNTSVKLFSDVAVRRAFLKATDINTIIDTVYNGQGTPINSPILPEQVAGIPEPTIMYDVEAAKAELDKAGWVFDPETNARSKRGTQLAFTLATNNFSLNARTAELLAAQWQQIGAKVTLNILPTRELTENLIRPRAFDALLFAQKLGADPDPFVFWHSSQVKNPGLNLSGYANTTADKLMSEARATTDKNVRDEKYRQLHDIINLDIPAIFLVENVYSYAMDQSVQGLSMHVLPDTTMRFYDVNNWYIDTKRVLKK